SSVSSWRKVNFHGRTGGSPPRGTPGKATSATALERVRREPALRSQRRKAAVSISPARRRPNLSQSRERRYVGARRMEEDCSRAESAASAVGGELCESGQSNALG